MRYLSTTKLETNQNIKVHCNQLELCQLIHLSNKYALTAYYEHSLRCWGLISKPSKQRSLPLWNWQAEHDCTGSPQADHNLTKSHFLLIKRNKQFLHGFANALSSVWSAPLSPQHLSHSRLVINTAEWMNVWYKKSFWTKRGKCSSGHP